MTDTTATGAAAAAAGVPQPSRVVEIDEEQAAETTPRRHSSGLARNFVLPNSAHKLLGAPVPIAWVCRRRVCRSRGRQHGFWAVDLADCFALKACLKPHAQFSAAYTFVNLDNENKKLEAKELTSRMDAAMEAKELVRVEAPCLIASEGPGIPGIYKDKTLMLTRFDVQGATTSGNLA